MKILFLVFHGFSASNGISKKIMSQVEGLRSAGADVRVCHYEVGPGGSRSWMVDDTVIKDLGSGVIAKLKKRIDFSPVVDYVREQGIDLLYYRYFHNSNPFTIRMMRQVRRAGARIYVEVPTYPYDGEFVTAREKVELATDRMFRNRLFSYADKVVSFSPAESIFGRPVLLLSNGISLSAIPMRRSHVRPEGRLDLIGVAEIHFWHGFDRLIKGLAEYCAGPHDTEVYFHVVGEPYGELEREQTVGLATRLGLGDHVIFHGRLSGGALDEVFDSCDMAVGSLGRHRSGVHVMNSLKNREYAARGFAFMYSESDPDFDGSDFVMKVPEDETPVDIRECLSFFGNCHVSPEAIRKSVEGLDWKAQMPKVLYSADTSLHQ